MPTRAGSRPRKTGATRIMTTIRVGSRCSVPDQRTYRDNRGPPVEPDADVVTGGVTEACVPKSAASARHERGSAEREDFATSATGERVPPRPFWVGEISTRLQRGGHPDATLVPRAPGAHRDLGPSWWTARDPTAPLAVPCRRGERGARHRLWHRHRAHLHRPHLPLPCGRRGPLAADDRVGASTSARGGRRGPRH